MASLDRERLIRFGRDRAAQSAGPITAGIAIGMIKLVLAQQHQHHEPTWPLLPTFDPIRPPQ